MITSTTTNYLDHDYYTLLELFNALNNETQLYFTVISDSFYVTFKIFEIDNLQNKKLASYHIYLKKLSAKKRSDDSSKNCSNDDIKNLNLTKLDATGNSNISNINHMTNLKILDASYNSGITDEGIKNLSHQITQK